MTTIRCINRVDAARNHDGGSPRYHPLVILYKREWAQYMLAGMPRYSLSRSADGVYRGGRPKRPGARAETGGGGAREGVKA
jgi:hypothetical protein